MARMYSRRKGKSGSKKPIEKKVHAWMRYKQKEIEMLIIKMAKDGKTTGQIGLTLRDSYGIPSVKTVTEKSISQIIKEKNLQPELPEDLMALIKSAIAIDKHRENNKQDMTAKRGEQLITSKILRVVKYYKTSGRIPVDWKFDKSKVRLLTQ